MDEDGFFGFDPSVPTDDGGLSSDPPREEAIDLDDLNDETFGTTEPAGKDFDFEAANSRLVNQQQQQQQQQQQPLTGLESMWGKVSLTDRPAQPPQRDHILTPTSGAVGPGPSSLQMPQAMTLAELEAQLLAQPQQHLQQQHQRPLPMPAGPGPNAFGPGLLGPPGPGFGRPPPPGYPQGMLPPPPDMAAYYQLHMEQAHVAYMMQQQHSELLRLKRYDRIMTAYERNLICRIQFSQMRIEDGYFDDFYYLAYRNRTLGSGTALPAAHSSTLLPRALQQQQRNRLRENSNTTTVSIEGALGVIPKSVASRPKILMKILSDSPGTTPSGTVAPVSPAKMATPVQQQQNSAAAKSPRDVYHLVLWSIENVSQAIIDLEDWTEKDRRAAEKDRREAATPPQQRNEGDDQQPKMKFRNLAPRPKLHQNIVRGLLLTWPATKDAPEPAFTDRYARENIARFLKVQKGQRLIKRALAVLPHQEQVQAAILFGKSWDLLTIGGPTAADEIEVFVNAVSTPIVAIVNEFTFDEVVEFMGGMLNNWSLFTLFKVVISKIGLSLLNPLLMRAEVLKQQPDAVNEQNLAEWTRLFGLFFALLKGYFAAVLNQSTAVEDSWLLLAFLTLHANQQQRYDLLSEIRDKVMQSLHAGAEPPQPVAALLLAMGIDYRQLVALNAR